MLFRSTEDGPEPLGPFAPDRTREDPVEPDTDNYASIPPFSSTGKPNISLWPRLSPQAISSDSDSEDIQILDILNPTPLAFAYPMPSVAETNAPGRAAAAGATGDRVAPTRQAVDLDGADSETEVPLIRKRPKSRDPAPASPHRPAKRTKIIKKSAQRPKRKPTARADA